MKREGFENDCGGAVNGLPKLSVLMGMKGSRFQFGKQALLIWRLSRPPDDILGS